MPDLDLVGSLPRSKPRPQLAPLLHRILVLVPRGAERVFVRTVDIKWIHAAGNYCRIYAASSAYVHRTSVGSLEERLDPDLFRRIHRSTIVNLNFVQSICPTGAGDYDVSMTDGVSLRMSRTYWPGFGEFQ